MQSRRHPPRFMPFALPGACAALAFALALMPHPALALPQCGSASWYQLKGRTASGAMNDPSAMTAAHRSLPFGTKVRVSNLRNGRSVMVKINDRGPFVRGRIIDVSRAAAEKLGIRNAGHGRVRVSMAAGADGGCK